MSEKQVNVFQVLDEESGQRNESPSPTAEKTDDGPTLGLILQSNGGDTNISNNLAESQQWTSITRTRRLVPQSSLSKDVMGADNARNKAPSSTTTGSLGASTNESKKKSNP